MKPVAACKVVLAGFLGVVVASPEAFAASAFPCPSAPIRAAFFDFGDFHTEGTGFDVDVVDVLRERSGCAIDTRVMPRARIWHELADGSLDMAFSAIATEDRRSFSWFIPYVWQKNHCVMDRRFARDSSTLEHFIGDAERPLWGAVRGFRHGGELEVALDTLRSEDRVVEVTDVSQLAVLLRKGRVSGAYALPLVFRHWLRRGELDARFTVVDCAPAMPSTPHHIALSRSRFSAPEVEAWERLVANLRADGTMEGLLSAYLPVDAAAAAVSRPETESNIPP